MILLIFYMQVEDKHDESRPKPPVSVCSGYLSLIHSRPALLVVTLVTCPFVASFL